jgi:hypothetical protein
MATENLQDTRYDEALKQAQRGDVPFNAIASLLIEAHEAGDARATYAMATCTYTDVLYQGHAKGLALLREAAGSKIADALYDLALYDLAACYASGYAVRRTTVDQPDYFCRLHFTATNSLFTRSAVAIITGLACKRTDRSLAYD